MSETSAKLANILLKLSVLVGLALLFGRISYTDPIDIIILAGLFLLTIGDLLFQIYKKYISNGN